MAIVVMGVGGCGKTTFGRDLAEAIHGTFLDGDDFHSRDAIDKMSAGSALDDFDREPWLRKLDRALTARSEATVLACSALKRGYRDILRSGTPTVFLHLVVSEELARARLGTREEHFFPTSLVRSQFDTLEPLSPDESGLTLDASAPVPELVLQACEYLHRESGAWAPDRASTAWGALTDRRTR